MSENAIFLTAEALRQRIGTAVGGANEVYVGPPVASEVQTRRVSVLLFHTQVCQSLRNEPYLPPPGLGAADGVTGPRDAIPLDLRFLVTVFRTTGAASSDANELTTLGQIVRVLHGNPVLGGESTDGRTVRVTLDPYPMEEVSRIWGLFPQDGYRTSIVYLASPVYVEAGDVPAGPPVSDRELRGGSRAIEGQEEVA